MLQEIIDDMNRALEAGCYLAALGIALTLPDICGKAAYPEAKNVGDRYTQWFDENVGRYEICPIPEKAEDKTVIPRLTGQIVYSLRNSFLHQGTPNIGVTENKPPEPPFPHFALIKESPNPLYNYSDLSCVVNDTEKYLFVSIPRLCFILGATASGYYKEYPEKFNFFRYTLIDKDAGESEHKVLHL